MDHLGHRIGMALAAAGLTLALLLVLRFTLDVPLPLWACAAVPGLLGVIGFFVGEWLVRGLWRLVSEVFDVF